MAPAGRMPPRLARWYYPRWIPPTICAQGFTPPDNLLQNPVAGPKQQPVYMAARSRPREVQPRVGASAYPRGSPRPAGPARYGAIVPGCAVSPEGYRLGGPCGGRAPPAPRTPGYPLGGGSPPGLGPGGSSPPSGPEPATTPAMPGYPLGGGFAPGPGPAVPPHLAGPARYGAIVPGAPCPPRDTA